MNGPTGADEQAVRLSYRGPHSGGSNLPFDCVTAAIGHAKLMNATEFTITDALSNQVVLRGSRPSARHRFTTNTEGMTLPEWQVEMWLRAGSGFDNPDRMPDVTKRVRATSSTEASRLAVAEARAESPVPFRVVDVIVMRVADWKVRTA